MRDNPPCNIGFRLIYMILQITDSDELIQFLILISRSMRNQADFPYSEPKTKNQPPITKNSFLFLPSVRLINPQPCYPFSKCLISAQYIVGTAFLSCDIGLY